MHFGSFTEQIDTVETAVWIFFIAFAAVVYHLRQRDKREGYPMQASPLDETPLLGFPLPPDPAVYRLMEGGTTVAPHRFAQPPTTARPLHRFDGTPLVPNGDLLTTPLGPGAWVMRREAPMLTEQGEPMLQPLRRLPDWHIDAADLDPRGLPVLDRRFFPVGIVEDVWIDRSSKMLRMFEVRLDAASASASAPATVLVPIFHTDIRQRDREIRVTALDRRQFRNIPALADPAHIGAREYERINAYFAAGRFYRDADEFLDS